MARYQIFENKNATDKLVTIEAFDMRDALRVARDMFPELPDLEAVELED